MATYGGDLKKLQDLRDVGSLQAQVMLTAYCIAVLRSAVLDMGASSVPPFSRNSTGKSACRIPRHRSICHTMLTSHHSDILTVWHTVGLGTLGAEDGPLPRVASGEAARDKKMAKSHLLRVVYHQAYVVY